jgi:hypothetical protein
MLCFGMDNDIMLCDGELVVNIPRSDNWNGDISSTIRCQIPIVGDREVFVPKQSRPECEFTMQMCESL